MLPEFTHLKAYKKLQELAQHPFDLRNLQPDRIHSYVGESCGFRLFYGTERVDEVTMEVLAALAQESKALEKMEKMQAGEIINFIEGYPSENRAVLHTAVRDFFDHPNSAKAAKEAASMALKEVEKLKNFLPEVAGFTDLILVGIGGSFLGPQATYLALKAYEQPNRRVHFISNVDPDDAASVLAGLDLKKCLVAVVSKSGTTLETATNEALVKEAYVKAGLDSQKYFIAVTGEGSPMDKPEKYLISFYIWDWIGGRFSTASMVGGLVLAFAFGFDAYWEFLRGASDMDKAALKNDVNYNVPLLAALLGIWNRNFLNHPVLAVIPYSQALSRYPAHWQQVDMESNGKHIDHYGRLVDFDTGAIIFGEPGTNGQHSFYQLLHQGTTVVPIEFIGFKESQYAKDLTVQGTTSQQKLLANLFAQSIAMATGKEDHNPNKSFDGNRPSHIIMGNKLTPYSLGALYSFYEHKVAFQGFIWNINSFDQEGVQLGKVLATQILDRMSGKNTEPYALGDAFVEELEHLK